jgi:hypothetical protein
MVGRLGWAHTQKGQQNPPEKNRKQILPFSGKKATSVETHTPSVLECKSQFSNILAQGVT